MSERDGLSFSEALTVFADKFCALRMARGEPVMLVEFVNGLALMLVATLDSLEPEQREIIRRAVVSALEDDAPTSRKDLN